ncbi:DNA-directed RNA polymerase subunit alpha C-terminal domain-containing protein [Pantoea eucrina]|uniref:DNA-directed RNA polymerase subunit alpha C-terminal domain-containing protein n=1 Tax=Pantoea eucrina TaxID=472693 RepID=UPI002FDA0438
MSSQNLLQKLQQLPECPVDDEVLHQTFVAAYGQLASIRKRLKLDDLENRLLDNCLAALEQVQIDIGQRLNHEADTYNVLADALEHVQQQLDSHSALSLEITQIRLDAQNAADEAIQQANMHAAEADSRAINAENAHERASGALVTAQLALTTLNNEFAQYRRKNPERLALDLQERDKTISQLRADRKKQSALKLELQQKLNIADKEVGKERRLRGETANELIKLTALHNNLKERVEFHDGQEDVAQFLLPLPDGSGDVGCYIYNYHFGLSVFHGMRDVSIETANFHYQIRTAMMLAMDVVPGVWGNPVFRILPDLLPMWDTAINDELHERIMTRLALDFPRLHQRIIDGKAAPVSELVIPARALNALIKAGYETVAAVGGELPPELVKVKGLSEATVEEIRMAVNSWCINWAKTNGDIEPIKNGNLKRR